MTILDKIAASTLVRIQNRKNKTSISELESRPAYNAPALSLADALSKSKGDKSPAIIAEVKKASPSQGIIRSEFNPPALGKNYQDQGASAISVLTEPDYFQGSHDYMMAVRQMVSLPILCKDFILDPYQITEARAYGADAILLIASLLDKTQLYDLQQAAHDIGLSCLVEVHSEDELAKVNFDQTEIIGVNNRNLKTFKVDLNLAPQILQNVPDHIVKVAESGLNSPADLKGLQQKGINAFLIGTAFMKKPNPGGALSNLIAGVQGKPLNRTLFAIAI